MVRPPMRPAIGMVLWKVSWLAERFFMGSCFVFSFSSSLLNCWCEKIMMSENLHDPGEEQESHTLPVDGFESPVAETDTDCGTGDAHGCGDGKFVLREDEDGDGSACE